MRSTLGSITATVSVRIGDGDPADIATIDIPITVSPTFTGADIVVDRKQTNRNLADALHAAAHELAPHVHPPQYRTDEDRECGARGIDPSLVVFDEPKEREQ